MFLKRVNMKNIIEQLKKKINEADAIIIGGGAGLSSAAGFEYGGKTFLDNFPEVHVKYGVDNMYYAGFLNFETSEEKWGYWSKFVYLNRYKDGSKPLYRKLLELVKNKNYFVITTNVDHQFQLAGFDKNRLFYTQGDYGLFQCSKPCHKKTYDNKEQILEMVQKQKDGVIPTSLIPKCPVCGEEMSMNLRSDGTFVEDEGWHRAAERYFDFLNENAMKKILFLELGVGFNTPGIIKYPFMNMTYSNPNAFYVCINRGENYIPKEIENRSLILDSDLAEIIEELVK